MEFFNECSEIFWNEKFWLPQNVTWKDIEPGTRGVNYTNYKDVAWPIPLSILIICIRCILDNCCFKPLGKYLRIKETRDNPPEQNSTLEAAYRRLTKLNRLVILKLTKQLDWSEREIERWWRKRKAQDKPTTLAKFCETSWKCSFYLFNFTFGMSVLWNEPYLWDFLSCGDGFPYHTISNGIWWYYMISLSFYWSSTITHFFEHKRKDFWQMFIHHVLALLLMSLSWICNIHRIGSLILAVHDCADIFLEAAKSLKYAKLRNACDVVFGVFAVVWIITRLILFPRMVFATMFQSQLKPYPMFLIFNAMLVGVLILHVIWTRMIFNVIKNSFESGALDDVRSSS